MAIHDYNNVYMKARRWISTEQGLELKNSKMLVIGCGYNYAEPLLWASDCDYVVGVDLRNSFWRTGFKSLVAELRDSGEPRIRAYARALIRRRAYRDYHDNLRRVSGMTIDEMTQDVITYDGYRLPFADKSFDVILSNAVLEHVSDLRALIREMSRVTRDGGFGYHLWHNYYSLSGAHVPDEIALARPWGHLLGDSRVDDWLKLSGTYLNRKTPSEIVGVLSTDFDEIFVHSLDKDHNVHGVDSGFSFEGDHFLNPELHAMIGTQPRDVLLTRAYSFMGKKCAMLRK